MSVTIYSEYNSPRLAYILDFIFNNAIPCAYSFTTDFNTFNNSTGAKINYAQTKSNQGIQIVPHTLLFEKNITPQNIVTYEWKKHIAFFKTSDALVSFDLFAASFYLMSRYEEYLDKNKDEYQRYPHENSLAFREGFLNIPLVDYWIEELKKLLLQVYPILPFQKKEFTFLPTYDIDMAFSYRHKGFWRNFGGAVKDVCNLNIAAIKNRIAVLRHKAQDPFDSFDFLDEVHKLNKLDPIYFFLLGSGGPLDKNISPENINFKNLVQALATKYETGIHPSFRSNAETQELLIEIKRLHKISNKIITKSRQHYIRFQLPETYQTLIKNGITEDYSMGYGSINGFRASTSNPFIWFDLSKNEATTLRIIPFCFMDCNSFFEQKQSLAKTQIELKALVKSVKNVNGTFVSIWHNFSLGTDPLWKDWSKLYTYQISLCIQ